MTDTMDKLIEQCRAGDEQAVATLVARFCVYGRDLAGALLGDDHLAEDAVQESFLTALRRLEDLREPAAFPGWFRQIVRSQCNRILRKQKERLQPELPEQPANAPSPLQQVGRDERTAQVRAALAALPPVNRQSAELYYLAELKCAEIATRLDVPTGTVKRRLHDARSQLRTMLLGHIPTWDARRPPATPRKTHMPL